MRRSTATSWTRWNMDDEAPDCLFCGARMLADATVLLTGSFRDQDHVTVKAANNFKCPACGFAVQWTSSDSWPTGGRR